MNILTNKKYANYDYTSRYTTVPYYYNTEDKKYMYGLGSNISKDLPYTVHTVSKYDSLDSIALTYYNNPTYYWVLCYFNDIPDALIESLYDEYKTLKIPNIASIQFGESR